VTLPGLVNLNGALIPAAEARVSLFDHGLLYGDGLFETLRVYGGRFFRLEAHLARLRDSALRLDCPLPWPDEELARSLRETVVANDIPDGALRLTVTRGAGAPVPDSAACEESTYFVTARAWTPPGPEAFERGVSVCLAGRHPRWTVPGMKSLCYLPFQQARQEARRRGFDEGLLMDRDQVVEAATSNLFAVHDGVLLTPGLESGCLPGITRAVVLELAREAGIPCREQSLDHALLLECEELFLTNSLQEIVPVCRLEERTTGAGTPGPVTRRLHALYRERVRSEAG
jgi:branched-chain amino acid aminotransferase